MPFRAGSTPPPADETMPFRAGTGTNPPNADATMPFRAGTGTNPPAADETMPFRAGTGFPAATPPWNVSPPPSQTPSWNGPSSGVGASDASGRPFGGAPAQVSSPFHPPGSGVPGQRLDGTVYGNDSPADMTMPVNMNAVENSGSLTGHILAQGWDRGVDTNRRSNVKVGVAMLVVLLVIVGISLLFLFTVGDAFSDMMNGVFGGE